MSRRGAREGRGARAAAARRMRGLNMAQPRPSLTLIVDVDERIDSEELRLEIGRSYTYVGSALVRTHAAESDDAPVENTLRMLVKLSTRQYRQPDAYLQQAPARNRRRPGAYVHMA